MFDRIFKYVIPFMICYVFVCWRYVIVYSIQICISFKFMWEYF